MGLDVNSDHFNLWNLNLQKKRQCKKLTKHLSQASPVTSCLQRHSPVCLLHPSLLNEPNKLQLHGRQPFGSSAVSFQNPFLQWSHLK